VEDSKDLTTTTKMQTVKETTNYLKLMQSYNNDADDDDEHEDNDGDDDNDPDADCGRDI